MFKRLSCALCVLVTVTLLVCGFSALAEEATNAQGSRMPSIDNQTSVVVGYLPTSENSNIVMTARYAALAIQSRYAAQPFSAATLNAAENKNKLQQNPSDFNSLISSSDAKGTNAKKGFNTSEASALAGTDKATHVWLIMDVSATNELGNDSVLVQQLSAMLENENLSLTFVMIGDTAFAPNGGTAIASLVANESGRVTWVQLQSDFLKQSVAQDTLHTGNWFAAALFGDPMDLTTTNVEGENFVAFDMPVSGEAVIISQQDGTVGRPTVADEDSNEPYNETSSFEYSANNREKINFVVTKLSGLSAGKRYTVDYGNDANLTCVRVYCLPDYAKLNPTLQLASVLTRTEQTATLTVAENAFGQGERFHVQWNWNASDMNGSAYDATIRGWSLTHSPEKDDTSVQLYATLKLYANDGDLLYTWKSETVEGTVVNTSVEATEKTQGLDLYYFDNSYTSNSVSFSVSDFVSYNTNDEISLFINEHDLSTEAEFDVADGYTLTYDSANNVVTITLDNSFGDPFDITLRAQSEEQTASVVITIQPYCVNILAGQHEWTLQDIDGKDVAVSDDGEKSLYTVKAGQTYMWADEFDEAAIEAWKNITPEAVENGAPRVEDLTYVLTTMTEQDVLSKDELQLTEVVDSSNETYLSTVTDLSMANIASGIYLEVPITADNEGIYGASATIELDSQWAHDDSITLYGYVTYHDLATGELRVLSKSEVELCVSNHNVSVIGSTGEQPYEVSLDGMPNNLETSEINLCEVLGINSIQELFTDEETPDSLVYSLRVSDANGVFIKQNQENVATSTELLGTAETTLYEGIDASNSIMIGFSTKGDKQITVYASDSVNEPPAEITFSFHVISSFEKTAGYVLIAVAALIVLVIIILIIVQIKKPAFADMEVRCVACAETTGNGAVDELLKAGHPASLKQFKKGKITLQQLLVMTRQMVLSRETAALTEDIQIVAGRDHSLVLRYGKNSRKQMTNKKKDTVRKNERLTIKHDKTTIVLQNGREDGM